MGISAAGSVSSKYYHVTVYAGTDQRNMSGRFYYDGTYVWQSASYRNAVGWHDCWVSYSSVAGSWWT